METKDLADILSATPTKEQVKAWRSLSHDQKVQALDEALEAGLNSGTSDKSLEDIYFEIFNEPMPLNETN